jgi:hypothetical protein
MLTSGQITGLMQLIGLTREREIDCDQCVEQVAEFAEQRIAGRPLTEALRLVEHHLAVCADCREEFTALQVALAGLESAGSS